MGDLKEGQFGVGLIEKLDQGQWGRFNGRVRGRKVRLIIGEWEEGRLYSIKWESWNSKVSGGGGGQFNGVGREALGSF